MSLALTLRRRFGDEPIDWQAEGPVLGVWQGGARRILTAHEGPLTAAAIVDARLLGHAEGARVVLAHEGTPTEVARRCAERFGVSLVRLDAPKAAPAPAEAATRRARLQPPAPIAGLLVAHMQASPATAVPRVAAATARPPAAQDFPVPTQGWLDLVLPPMTTPAPAQAEDFPIPPAGWLDVALPFPPTPEAPPAAETVPFLPWDPQTVAPEAPIVHVTPEELARLPWHDAPPSPEDTATPHLQPLPAPLAPSWQAIRRTPMDWGLPWPRPGGGITPEALSRSEPHVWGQSERMAKMREALERQGAPSFGAARPEGSAWLSKLRDGAGP